MPVRPPLHRPSTAHFVQRARRAFDVQRGTAHERGYNARWQRASKAFLVEHPLCMCGECDNGKRRIRPATVVDHIRPHRGNFELFWNASNWQALAKVCHDKKTARESGLARQGNDARPSWLAKPGCPVVLVIGPPCGGKSTYAMKHATPSDVVIDLDECFTDVCGVHGHEAPRMYLSAAIRLRNQQLADLEFKKRGRAFVLMTCARPADEIFWRDLLRADVVVCNPGRSVALSRLQEGPLLADRRRAINAWYDARTRGTYAGARNGNAIRRRARLAR
jgi:5-methylcytosine-specific restriction enzyme A